MLAYRVIARLDIKGPNLIKGRCFEGLRVLGKPADFAKRYADGGADEIIYIDTVATLYGRNQLEELIEETAAEVFVPITVGGGISSVAQARSLMRRGADKVFVNSAAIRRPALLSEIACAFGSQAVAVSIEAKRTEWGWEAYTDCGRNPSGRCAIEWANEACSLGAGELLVTSIDRDGTKSGCDVGLIEALSVEVPLIYSGGIRIQDAEEVSKKSSGMAIGASLHYGNCTIADIKKEVSKFREVR